MDIRGGTQPRGGVVRELVQPKTHRGVRHDSTGTCGPDPPPWLSHGLWQPGEQGRPHSRSRPSRSLQKVKPQGAQLFVATAAAVMLPEVAAVLRDHVRSAHAEQD